MRYQVVQSMLYVYGTLWDGTDADYAYHLSDEQVQEFREIIKQKSHPAIARGVKSVAGDFQHIEHYELELEIGISTLKFHS